MIKKLMVLVMVVTFTLGVAGASFSQEQEIKGTVANIEGNKITIRDEMGKQTTINVKPMALQGFNVGDKVLVKDGKLTKE